MSLCDTRYWEMFNALNQPVFANLHSDIANPATFGVVTGLPVNPGIMQVGGRIEF